MTFSKQSIIVSCIHNQDKEEKMHTINTIIIKKFYTVQELSNYADDQGTALIHQTIPEMMLALYNKDETQAEYLLDTCMQDILEYALSFNDSDEFYHCAEHGAEVTEHMITSFHQAFTSLEPLMQQACMLQGKQHIRKSTEAYNLIISLVVALNKNKQEWFDYLINQAQQDIEKMLRKEERGIIE